jgi:hypothetical protein
MTVVPSVLHWVDAMAGRWVVPMAVLRAVLKAVLMAPLKVLHWDTRKAHPTADWWVALKAYLMVVSSVVLSVAPTAQPMVVRMAVPRAVPTAQQTAERWVVPTAAR